MATTLNKGDQAPSFKLTDQNGSSVSLSDFQGKKVLVYFYPKADTPGCTTQSCAVRDSYESLSKQGIVAIGISPDPPSKQKKFDNKYQLGFLLLSDEDHVVAEAYGVWQEKSMYGKKYMGIVRSAFVIDEHGKLADVYYKISPADTVPFAIKTIEG